MLEETSGPWKLILSILFFPLFFQGAFMKFVWGAGDPQLLCFLKRGLLLFPAASIVFACWMTVVCLLTVIVRQNRIDFLTALLITWWDLGKAIFSFWGGLFRFIFLLVGSFFLLIRMIFTGFWAMIQDALLMPFRTIKGIGENVLNPGIPWIAVFLTLGWCMIEAGLFTYVTTPLVLDTLANLTEDSLPLQYIRIPLFFFVLVMVLGSYSVLSTWAEAIASRQIPAIIKIGLLEFVTMAVEVLYLYREFVDALVPWFAQHSAGQFDLGVKGTLMIAFLAWVGIRSMSWFLFARAGTPTILAVIQRSGLKSSHGVSRIHPDSYAASSAQIERIKKEMAWLQQKGEEILGAFILPPLQILATSINFVTLLITAQHLLPRHFESLAEVMNAKTVLQDYHPKKNK